MAFKFIVALALVAVVSAGYVPATQVYHAAQPVLAKSEEANDPHPQYQFSYSVNDALTGDVKSQTETRDGDLVQGEYSLNDADGYKRTVQYSSDAVNGFNAIVNREPLANLVKTAVAAAPVAYAAPTLVKSAPLAYAAAPTLIKSAPIGYASYSAPTLVKSAPLAYAAAPTLVRSAPLGYASYAAPAYTQTYAHAAAPALIRSSPIAYAHGPAAYTTQGLLRSSPIAYAAAPAYATAPAYALHH